jgi:hypothetical protein
LDRKHAPFCGERPRYGTFTIPWCIAARYSGRAPRREQQIGKASLICFALLFAALAARGAGASEEAPIEPPSGDVLLLDSVGRPVEKPVESLPEDLRPKTESELKQQTPDPRKGQKLPEAVRDKLESMQEGLPPFEWLPAAPPKLMPYLYSQDELGNTVARPGPLIDVFPLEGMAQGSKTWLSQRGLRYQLTQVFT